MRFVPCTYAAHAGALLEILNEVIASSTALYDYTPYAPERMIGWFKEKDVARLPVIGAEDGDGRLLGFATYDPFRRWPAYKYSVEHSLHVHKDHRGKGIGFALMERLITAAREQQYHSMIGAIDSANAASIALHRKLGFVHAGTIRQAGFKFACWHDLTYYQLILDTPARPVEG